MKISQYSTNMILHNVQFLTELPTLQNLKVTMNLEQNKVFLNWTRLDAEILSSSLMLSYKLFYTTRGACAVSKCQKGMCRAQKKIKSKFNSVMFNQELLPFTNYTWRLELTYTNNGSMVKQCNISVDVKTSQSGEYIINST